MRGLAYAKCYFIVAALGAALACLSGVAPAFAQADKPARVGGTFELTDHMGKPFSSAQLAGSPYAIFFGFTHCPDVCPTTLLAMSNSLAALGPEADALRVIFVSVDPERDTAAHIREYLSSFDARIVGLTGSAEQIAATAKAWNAFYHKLPETDGSYTISHSAYVYLMDRDNRLRGTLGFNESEADQIGKLRALLAGTLN
jgi:protein SCO1/2